MLDPKEKKMDWFEECEEWFHDVTQVEELGDLSSYGLDDIMGD